MKRPFLAVILALVLVCIPLNVKPTYASAPDRITSTADCSLFQGGNAASPMVVDCKVSPVADGYVDNLIPSKSFAGSGVLIVQNVPSVPVSITDAFLKFDLNSTLPPELVESMARPENATLAMYVRLMNFFYNSTVEVHSAFPGNWTENSLTWNTMPNFTVNSYASLNIVQNGTWARWDLLKVIQPAFNSSGQLALVALSAQTNWKNLIWFDSFEYPFSNGTTAPTLDLTFTEPYLTIRTPYLNTRVSVGNTVLMTGADGVVRTILPWGIYHVSVPMTIPIADGTRARFVDWSDGSNSSSRQVSVGNNITLTADYGIQHDVTVNSPYGLVSGAGWYFESAETTISISPTSVPLEGLAGWIGARYVFDHWTGACTGTSTQCSLVVNSPKSASAVWRVDWFLTWIAIGILTLLTGILVTMRCRLRLRAERVSLRKTRKRRKGVRRRLFDKIGAFTPLQMIVSRFEH